MMNMISRMLILLTFIFTLRCEENINNNVNGFTTASTFKKTESCISEDKNKSCSLAEDTSPPSGSLETADTVNKDLKYKNVKIKGDDIETISATPKVKNTLEAKAIDKKESFEDHTTKVESDRSDVNKNDSMAQKTKSENINNANADGSIESTDTTFVNNDFISLDKRASNRNNKAFAPPTNEINNELASGDGIQDYTDKTLTEATTEIINVTQVISNDSNSVLAPPIVMNENDENTVLTHKTTSIPRNTFTRVAIQDCPCDVIKNVCDINCCCDNDCSAYERLVFSKCLPLPSRISHSQYCFSKQLIYIKNAPYYITKHPDNSLLCIETENLRSKTNFTTLKPITNLKNINKIFNKRKYNVWSAAVLRASSSGYSLVHLPHNQSYKVGQPIWMITSSSVDQLQLPQASILSDQCASSRKIFYLEDITSECRIHLTECSHDSKMLSPSQYYKSFLILASTSFENLTTVQNCTKQSCLIVEPYSCSNGNCSLMSDVVTPQLDQTSLLCMNLTQFIHFVFKHNGTHGITKVLVYFTFADVELNQYVLLKTKVTFEWHDAHERSFHRSGNPGYQVGKPLITGTRLLFNSSQEEVGIPSIYFSTASHKWITMPSFTLEEGACDQHHRKNIMFGINEQVTCSYIFQRNELANCKLLQRQVFEMLLGNIPYMDSNTYVASNGDPNIHNIDDWIPILWNNIGDIKYNQDVTMCSLTSGIHMKIIQTYAGEFSNPHTKIIGALIETFKQSNVFCKERPHSERQSSQSTCSMDLTFSVSFIHTSNLPFTKFPEPPVYEIKLPSNFFYPFLSGTGKSCVLCKSLMFVCLVLCILFLDF